MRSLPVLGSAVLVWLCLLEAAAPPVVGNWEGTRDGAKAATLSVQQVDGALRGTAIFYIIRDEGSGAHNGAPTPAMPLAGIQWDGKVLRFSVVNPAGKKLAFEFRVMSEALGELRRPAQDGDEEIKVPMRRAR